MKAYKLHSPSTTCFSRLTKNDSERLCWSETHSDLSLLAWINAKDVPRKSSLNLEHFVSNEHVENLIQLLPIFSHLRFVVAKDWRQQTY